MFRCFAASHRFVIKVNPKKRTSFILYFERKGLYTGLYGACPYGTTPYARDFVPRCAAP